MALVLSRQNLPVLEETTICPEESVARGAYVLHEGAERPDVVVIASGSEVSPALCAAKALEKEDVRVRVVSMPCQEWFAVQPVSFQQSVVPAGVPRVVFEAASSFGCRVRARRANCRCAIWPSTSASANSANALTAEHVWAVTALLERPGTRAEIALPGGLRASRDDHLIVIVRA